jgi:ketosteroid isomerase-like protein
VSRGDLQGLLDVLAPDVVVVADGGGLAPAALRPFRGRARVANALSRFTSFVPATPPMTTALINGAVAARLDPGGEFDTAITFVIEDGLITQMHAIRNPHKLGRLDTVADLRR